MQPQWPWGPGEMAERIRAHDWGTTSLGALATWPQSLRTAVDIVLAMPSPATILWGPEHVQLYNDAYVTVARDRHPSLLGRPVSQGWPDVYDSVVGPLLAETRAGRSRSLSGYEVSLRGSDGARAERVFDTDWSPLRDESGVVAGALQTLTETTAWRQDDAILRESEARLSAAFASVPAGLAVFDLAGAALVANSEYLRFLPTGVIPSRDFERGGRWRAWDEAGRLIDPHDYPGARALRGERVVPGQEMLYTDDEGRETWTRVGTVPVLDASGHVISVVSVISDIDDLKRGGDALRESETRFQQFASSSLDALWIRDAATLVLEYTSPAFQTIYGVHSEALRGEVKTWAAIIVPEDRAGALMHLEQARRGEAVMHEFRIIRPSDGAFRWIRDTDFPLHDERGRVQRIGGIAVDVTEEKQAETHRSVLLHELQHRVRNILAMTHSIASRTGDTAADVAAYRDLLGGRLRALSRVQVLLTQAANIGVDLATLVRAEVDAQAADDGQYSVSGPKLTLAPKAAEVLTLGIHELATNALKYGAFSHADGRLAVSWSVVYPAEEPWLSLDWIETGAPAPLAPPKREGFGTILIQERIPYELQGQARLTYHPTGLRCLLEFPLRQGDSILETDSVTLSPAIAGGCLDMTGETDLGGRRVLVIEDDFFLATDTERALRRAGGQVLGPVGHGRRALDLIARDTPHCAVVDINLGHGAEFAVSEALQDAGVPFVFVTGYSDVMIPARFDGVERLRKPVDFRRMVRIIARLRAA